jgi:hypothetical protein
MGIATSSLSTAAASMRRDQTARITGAAGLLFFVAIVLQNVVRSTGPLSGADAATILAYVTGQGTTLAILLGVFPPAFVALFVFVTGVRRLVAAADSTTAWWAEIGLVGAIMIGAMFAASNAIEATLVAAGQNLASEPGLLTTLWTLHGALFALNSIGIGLALAGLSQAAVRAGLAPGWSGWVGLAGGVLLVGGAMPVVAVAGGSPLIVVSLLGFVCWCAWLLVCGISILRGSSRAA